MVLHINSLMGPPGREGFFIQKGDEQKRNVAGGFSINRHSGKDLTCHNENRGFQAGINQLTLHGAGGLEVIGKEVLIRVELSRGRCGHSAGDHLRALLQPGTTSILTAVGWMGYSQVIKPRMSLIACLPRIYKRKKRVLLYLTGKMMAVLRGTLNKTGNRRRYELESIFRLSG